MHSTGQALSHSFFCDQEVKDFNQAFWTCLLTLILTFHTRSQQVAMCNSYTRSQGQVFSHCMLDNLSVWMGTFQLLSTGTMLSPKVQLISPFWPIGPQVLHLWQPILPPNKEREDEGHWCIIAIPVLGKQRQVTLCLLLNSQPSLLGDF